MASHPIIWVMTSPCMLIYMGMIQGTLRIWNYIPGCHKGIYKRSILYKGSSLWNKLPPWVKESTSLNDFKQNFRFLNVWIHPEFIVLFIHTPILYPILMLLFCQFCLQLVRYINIRNLSQSYHDIVFMHDLYLWMYECVYMCSLYLCILLCNREEQCNWMVYPV